MGLKLPVTLVHFPSKCVSFSPEVTLLQPLLYPSASKPLPSLSRQTPHSLDLGGAGNNQEKKKTVKVNLSSPSLPDMDPFYQPLPPPTSCE